MTLTTESLVSFGIPFPFYRRDFAANSRRDLLANKVDGGVLHIFQTFQVIKEHLVICHHSIGFLQHFYYRTLILLPNSFALIIVLFVYSGGYRIFE